MAGRIEQKFGRIDVLVNNAGTNITERHWDRVSPEKWREVIDIDLSGAFYCVRAVLPLMRRQQDGLIINVSSWAGRFYSLLTGPAYTAAKHGMTAMNASINMEECKRYPCLCDVSGRGLDTDYRPAADQLSKEVKEKMLKPEDVGEAIVFLARLPKTVCINELVISPTWNRGYLAELNPPL